MIIYRVTNTINGKIYIGQTRNTLQARITSHMNRVRSNVNRPFYNAIRKYGEDAFKWEVLEEVTSLDIMDSRESYFIEINNSIHPHGYNLMSTGNNGHTISEHTRNKRSKAARRPCKETTKLKISHALKKRYVKEGFCSERACKISKTLKEKSIRTKSKFKLICKHPIKGVFEYDYTVDFCNTHNVNKTAVNRWVRGTCASKEGWTVEKIYHAKK